MNTVHPLVQRALTFIVALVAVFAVSQVAVAKPAQAHNELGWGFCTGATKVCAAIHANGYGNYIIFTSAVGQCWGITGFMNNNITSVDSHHHGAANFYNNSNCTGFLRTYAAFATINNVGALVNDTFSAICIGPRGGSSGCP